MYPVKSRNLMLVVALLTLPSVLLLCAASSELVALSLAAAVLVKVWVSDCSVDNLLYEEESSPSEQVSDKQVNVEMVPHFT